MMMTSLPTVCVIPSSALPSNVLFEGFADTGRSSTGIRMKESLQAIAPVRQVAPAIINRYMEPIRRSESRSTTVLKELDLQRHGMHYALTDYDMRNYVWRSGCRDDQTAVDADIQEGRGWHGAFTYYLCDEIRKFGNRKTRSALMDSIRAVLAGRYTQAPQLHSRPEYHTKRFLHMH
jgi:metacaspase-1